MYTSIDLIFDFIIIALKYKGYCLFYDEVRGWDEHDHGGHHSVHAEPDEAKPVNHHRREFPVGDDQLLLILFSRPLCQESDKRVIKDVQVVSTLITWALWVWVWPPGPGSCWRWRPSWWRGSSAEEAGLGGRGRSGSCGRSGWSRADHPPQGCSSALCLIWAWGKKVAETLRLGDEIRKL